MKKDEKVDLTHMPQYIKKAPWYVNDNQEGEALKH